MTRFRMVAANRRTQPGAGHAAGLFAGLTMALLAIVAVPDAQTVPPPPPPAPVGSASGAPGQNGTDATGPTGTALILGRVVEAGTATPVGDALVTLTGGALGRGGAVFGGNGLHVLTGADGYFLFRDLARGTYQVAVTATGYLEGLYGRTTPPSPIARVLDVNRGIELADNEQRRDVTVQLWKPGVITGTITDEAGEPMPLVTVRMMPVAETWGGPLLGSAVGAFGTTDDRGIYRVDVSPGSYFVAVIGSPTTMPSSAIDAYQQSIAAGQTASRAYSDQLQANGAPFPVAQGLHIGDLIVSASQGRAGSTPPAMIHADGRLYVYPTTYYPSGSTSATATLVTIGSGEEKAGVDLQLRPRVTVCVSGIVSGPSGPMAGLGVNLIPPDWGKQSSPAVVPDEMRTVTDANGAFTFLGVLPGAYTLQALRTPVVSRQVTSIAITGGAMFVEASAPGPAATTNEPIAWAAQPIVVNDTDLSNVVIQMQAGARISGRVAFAGTTATVPTGQPLHNIAVNARAVPGSMGALVSVQSTGHVDDNDQFTTGQYVPGKYLISANAPPQWVLQSVMVNGQDAADVPVDLDSGGLNDVVITFSDRISKISGAVRGADGQIPGTATVVVFPADSALWPRVGLTSRRERTTPAGTTGQFTLSSLPDGDYVVAATVTVGVDFTDPKVLNALLSSGTRVSIENGSARMVDLRAVEIRP